MYKRLSFVVSVLLVLAMIATGCTAIIQPQVDAAVQATLTANQPQIDAAVQATLTAMVPDATPTPDCKTATQQWLLDLEPLLAEWEDAVDVVVATNKASLAGPVAEMQRISREIEQTPYPPCAETAYKYLVNYCNVATKGVIDFMKGWSTYGNFDGAAKVYKKFQAEVDVLLASK
ncbi:MAG: hypothetical protein GXY52_11265 [Chloroflexi bacterium]|nr:hypothetical protein [Chloroflexota bacterium]